MVIKKIQTNEIRFYPIFDEKIKDEVVIGGDATIEIEQDIKVVKHEFFNKVESDYRIKWDVKKPSDCKEYAMALYIGKHKMFFIPLVSDNKVGGKYISLGTYQGWQSFILCKRKNLSKLLRQYEWLN